MAFPAEGLVNLDVNPGHTCSCDFQTMPTHCLKQRTRQYLLRRYNGLRSPVIWRQSLHFLMFSQAVKAGEMGCGNMDKHVLATLFGCDEIVALGRIEPFHGARLCLLLFCFNKDAVGTKAWSEEFSTRTSSANAPPEKPKIQRSSTQSGQSGIHTLVSDENP